MDLLRRQDRWARFGKLAGLAAFSFFLAKGVLWLVIPALLIGSCAK